MTNKREIELAAYDVNGTLFVDASGADAPFWTALNGIFVKFGMPPLEFNVLRREFGQPGHPWTKVYRDRGITEEMASDVELYRLYNEFYRTQPPAPPFEGLTETLRWLKGRGIILAIVSTQQDEITIPHLERYGLRGFFSYIEGGRGDKAAALEKVFRLAGVRPSRAAYIGDQEGDILHAKAAKCISIGFCSGVHSLERLAKVKPDFLIHRHDEIKRLPLF